MVFWNCGGGRYNDTAMIAVQKPPGGTQNYGIVRSPLKSVAGVIVLPARV